MTASQINANDKDDLVVAIAARLVAGKFYLERVNSPAPAISDAADITLANGSQTGVMAADTTRRSVIITAPASNTVTIRLGDTGTVSATRGLPLQPGERITLETTAALWGFATAASQKVALLFLTD